MPLQEIFTVDVSMIGGRMTTFCLAKVSKRTIGRVVEDHLRLNGFGGDDLSRWEIWLDVYLSSNPEKPLSVEDLNSLVTNGDKIVLQKKGE